MLWKPNIELLNPIIRPRCFSSSILWQKEASVSVSPGLPESLALPLRFIVLHISLDSLPNTCFSCDQACGWGLLPDLEFGYVVLWSFIWRLFLELENKKYTHNLLFQRSQGRGFIFSIILFLLKCLSVYAEKCLPPSMPCCWYVNLFALLSLQDPSLW